jgi:hypothetical protein
MLHRDLVKSALSHQASSRVPYTIHLTTEGYQAYADDLLKGYASAEILEDLRAGRFSKEEAVSLAIGLAQPERGNADQPHAAGRDAANDRVWQLRSVL